jgi:hypothetical protein
MFYGVGTRDWILFSRILYSALLTVDSVGMREHVDLMEQAAGRQQQGGSREAAGSRQQRGSRQ